MDRNLIAAILALALGGCAALPPIPSWTEPSDTDEGWELVQVEPDEQTGWVLERRFPAGSEFFEHQIRGLVDATPQQAIEAVRRNFTDDQYIRDGEEREVLEESEGELLIYWWMEIPGPFAARDYTIRYRFDEDTETQTTGVEWSLANDEGPELEDGVVRMPDGSGRWEFRLLPDGRSHATCVSHGSPGGNIPAAMSNMASGDFIVQYLGEIRAIAVEIAADSS